ncbi:MAG TPA: hypothetical protein VGC39_09090 [Candidatus Methylacidiphilales bacterium]
MNMDIARTLARLGSIERVGQTPARCLVADRGADENGRDATQNHGVTTSWHPMALIRESLPNV